MGTTTATVYVVDGMGQRQQCLDNGGWDSGNNVYVMMKRQRQYSSETVTLIALEWEDEEGKRKFGGLRACYIVLGDEVDIGRKHGVTHLRCRDGC